MEIMTAKTMLNCLKCSLIALFMLNFQVLKAQADFAGIDEIIKQNQKAIGNEVAILVSQEGKTVYSREIPEFRIKNPAPLHESSRWLTAAIVMIFVDEGKISLDDKVGKYLPILEKYSKGYITIRQCLANTTGIEADATGVLKLTQRHRFASLEEEVNMFVSKREIVDNAGTAYFYSNIGTNMAARVLEIVGKKGFDRLAQEKLFRPLSMRNTSFYSEKGAVDPSGGANGSAVDFMNFLNMLMNKGMFNGKKILSEESVEFLLTKPFTDQPVKYIPKSMASYTPLPGAWIEEADGAGKPLVISSPGFAGPLPWINFARNYAAIILPLKELSEEKTLPIQAIRREIDSHVK